MLMKEITYIFRSNLSIFTKGSIREMNPLNDGPQYTQSRMHYLELTMWQEPGWALWVTTQTFPIR